MICCSPLLLVSGFFFCSHFCDGLLTISFSCGVLQNVVVLQCAAVSCSDCYDLLLTTGNSRSVLQCVAARCSVLQCVAVRFSLLQRVSVCCSVWTLLQSLLSSVVYH